MADAGSEPLTNRQLVDRWIRAVTASDAELLRDLLHPDFVQELPQSGERVRGIDDFIRILEHYPGDTSIEPLDEPQVLGDEGPHFVMTPAFNLVKVEDSGDQITGYLRARYPDGSEWFIVTFFSFKDHKIVKEIDFFAPLLDPPEWRSAWVERMERPHREST